MRLTWKDGAATVLAMAVGVIAVATVQGWGWPLLGTYRSAGLVVFGIGAVMCPLGGSALATPGASRDPYVWFASLLGVVSLVALIGVLIWGTQAWFLTLVIATLVLWAAATIRHLVAGTLATRPVTVG